MIEFDDDNESAEWEGATRDLGDTVETNIDSA